MSKNVSTTEPRTIIGMYQVKVRNQYKLYETDCTTGKTTILGFFDTEDDAQDFLDDRGYEPDTIAFNQVQNIEYKTKEEIEADRVVEPYCRKGSLKRMIGRKFGQLTVIGLDKEKTTGNKRKEMYWECQCSCSKKVSFGHYYLWKVKSCGCASPVAGKVVEAWGESKTISQWAKDDRCKVSEWVIRYRLNQGWTTEDAISLETSSKKIKAWGESKTVREWVNDSRCSVRYENIKQRLASGWSPEDAIGLELQYEKKIAAWGETKTFKEWAKDERSDASAEVIRGRICNGWEPERAISKPQRAETVKVTAWGETKTIYGWVNDNRCRVCWETLKKRIQRGWSPEDAIATPAEQVQKTQAKTQ